MMMKDFLKTFEGMQAEQQWSRILNGLLVAVIFILVVLVFQKKTVVVVKPWALSEEAMIEEDDASAGYKESWGFMLSHLLGNVNPKTVSFAAKRLGPLLNPAIYQEVMDVMYQQANEIKIDRISMRFEPRDIVYEKTTNKTFVSGYSYIKGTAGDEKKSLRTYEFKIRIANYAPVIDFIDIYQGTPRTEKVLKKLELKEISRQEREKKHAAKQ